MARPREHDESTRAALLAAGGRILQREGAQALSLRRVADEIGTSTQAIYTLFGSKQGLIRAMYREGFANLDRHLATVEPSDDLAHDLRELALAYRASALSAPHLYEIMFACPLPEFEPDEADQRLALGTLHRLRATLRDHVDHGPLAGRDPDALTLQLWALGHGLATLELQEALGGPDEAERHWIESFEAAAAGYQAHRAASAS